jgi:hypothetical protein
VSIANGGNCLSLRPGLADFESSGSDVIEFPNHGLDLPSTSDYGDRNLVRLRRVKCDLEDQRKGDREEEREPHDRSNTASDREWRRSGHTAGLAIVTGELIRAGLPGRNAEPPAGARGAPPSPSSRNA